MSETRKNRGKVNMDGLYQLTNALSSGTILDPTACPSPRLGVRNPHRKLQSKIAGKRVHLEWNSLYGRHIVFFFWGGGTGSVGIARDRPKFLGYPY